MQPRAHCAAPAFNPKSELSPAGATESEGPIAHFSMTFGRRAMTFGHCGVPRWGEKDCDLCRARATPEDSCGAKATPEDLCRARATPEGLSMTSRGFQPPVCQALLPQPQRGCPMLGRPAGSLAGADALGGPRRKDRPSMGQPLRGWGHLASMSRGLKPPASRGEPLCGS